MIHRSKEPYKSSNIYRVTASLTPEFKNLNPFEKLEAARKVVFNFDYPTPDSISSDEFKRFFEHMFISRFWERWFRAETFESFTIQLYSKMLEIMPEYNIMLDTFFNENKEQIFLNKTTTKSKTENIGESETSNETNETSINETTSTNKNVASAFPASMMTAGDNINNVDYANNGNLSNDKTENENENERKGKTTTTETANGSTESETISGVLFDSIIKFNKEYNKIFTNLINEFNVLFSFIIC